MFLSHLFSQKVDDHDEHDVLKMLITRAMYKKLEFLSEWGV